MVPLHHVIQVLALTQANPTRKNSFRFQGFDSGWIRSVLIHVNDSRHGIAGELSALRKKRLAAVVSRWAVSRKSIVWPVESTARYRYLSSPFHLYIGLVRVVALVRRLQVWSTALIQLGRIGLHPA